MTVCDRAVREETSSTGPVFGAVPAMAYVRILMLVSLASCASLEDASPTLHLAHPVPTPSDPDTPNATNPQGTRFPPRVYSFDPRPHIDPGDLIYNPDDPGPQDDISDSSEKLGKYLDGASSGAPSVESRAPAESLTEETGHPEDMATLGESGGNITGRNSAEVSPAAAAVIDLPETAALTPDDEDERPRTIVDVRREGVSGEVSYIIHPDNQPPPTYQPLKDLPPPAHPVAQWRPDIFMKVCCSKPDSTPQPEDAMTSSSLEVKSETSQVSTDASPSSTSEEGKVTEQPAETGEEKLQVDDTDDKTEFDTGDPDEGEKETTTTISESVDDASTQRSSGNSTNETVGATNGTDLTTNNHTPRYEESGSSTYQEVTNFLKDIANSDGFKNAFLGDLIKNFGSLDQNAMKLIYSLLIRPLEGMKSSSSKEEQETVAETRPARPSRLHMSQEDFVSLERERLPLRDRPANGYHPFRTIFPQDRPSSNGRHPIRPSFPVRQMPPSDPSGNAWRPSRTSGRVPAYGRRGDEGIDVITAPPFQTFEVVLGSSLNHDKKYEEGGPEAPPASPSAPPLPFDKLTLGLEMPPPDALDALPPGAVLIPPSHILGRPNLPQIFNKKDPAPINERPLAEFLPNLPFFTKPPRLRPPASPEVQDIPPRLPAFLSSLLPDAPPPRPVRPPGQVAQSPRPSGPMETGASRPVVPNRRRPTGPPPPVNKMTPGQRVLPMVLRPQRPADQDSANSSVDNRDNAAPVSVPVPLLEPVPPPLLHPHDAAPSPSINVAPKQGGMMFHGNQEYSDTNQPPVTGVQSDGEPGSSGGVNRKPVNYVADRNEDYHTVDGVFIPNSSHDSLQPPSDTVYYRDTPPEYIVSYYDLDYQDYYQDQAGGAADGGLVAGEPGATGHRYPHDATGPVDAGDLADVPVTVTPTPTPKPGLNSPPEGFQPSLVDHILDGHQPSLDDLLGVIKPSVSPPTLTEQGKNNVQILLQNHRMANAMAESNGTVLNLVPAGGNGSAADDLPSGGASTPDSMTGDERMDEDQDHYWMPVTGPRGESQPSVPPLEPTLDVAYSEHDASVTHLWNNVQLIPLAPELFDSPGRDQDSMNLTSLFDGAVPLSPGASPDDVQDLSSDRDRITVDNTGGRVSFTEVVVEDADKADAKFMAYVLMGACCGLALLSITGVIVIVRFKKTCGSRQIKTRTRLTEQDSVENISRRVESLAAGGESGHKLGSWFTGRNEQLGSGKLRSNMALPEVHDLKRDKSSKSGSTRDLLSISSESSRSSSPRQVQHEREAAGRTDDEEPRNSWLHDEYRASVSDVSQVAGQDLAYMPHQYQQSHDNPHAASAKPHPPDHQRYLPDSSIEVEHLQRSSRSRRYTAQSRSDAGHLQRAASRRGPRYISSMDSEELEERLAIDDTRYNTDSELDDGTTQYDDDESREPSRYFSDSRELDDVVVPRRVDPKTMTSQELGEHLSRDLKQYQSRRVSRTQRQQQQEEEERNTSRLPESSSQEVEGEDGSRELQRSHSQVSFSRDNVQNEVFLEFDHILQQHGQYLNHTDPPASTLGRVSRGTDDTHLSVSRANTPDSIDLPSQFPQDSRDHNEGEPQPHSPPTTPPRFTPPPAPPRPPKPGHLSQPGTPSPQAGRARSPSPGHSPLSPARSQRPVHWTSDEERLI